MPDLTIKLSHDRWMLIQRSVARAKHAHLDDYYEARRAERAATKVSVYGAAITSDLHHRTVYDLIQFEEELAQLIRKELEETDGDEGPA